jgi:cytochrome P450
LSPPAIGKPALEKYATASNREAPRPTETLNAHAGAEAVDVHEPIALATLEVIGRTLLSVGFSERAGRALRAATELSLRKAPRSDLLELSIPDPNERAQFEARHAEFLSAQQLLDGELERLILSRRGAAAKPDVLGALLEAKNAEGPSFSEREIVEQLKTLVLAGHETSTSALSFTLYLLARHPEVQEKVRGECQLGVQGDAPTMRELDQLSYTGAVISESLRLYPPVPLLERRAVTDDMVGGYCIPKGTLVTLCPWVTHRKAEFFADPEAFVAERFLPGQEALHTGAYFPFGLGPRACIGRAMALVELKCFLWHLLSRLEFSLPPAFELQTEMLVTLRPKGGALPLCVN